MKFSEEKVDNYQSAKNMTYKDIEKPIPTFGKIYFYQIRAVKDYSTSPPASISVILLDRSK